MNKAQELLAQYDLDEADFQLFVSPSYDAAMVGVTPDNRAVYDYERMVTFLVETDKMTEEDAREFIDYNTVRALPYFPNGPIIIRLLEPDAYYL